MFESKLDHIIFKIFLGLEISYFLIIYQILKFLFIIIIAITIFIGFNLIIVMREQVQVAIVIIILQQENNIIARTVFLVEERFVVLVCIYIK